MKAGFPHRPDRPRASAPPVYALLLVAAALVFAALATSTPPARAFPRLPIGLSFRALPQCVPGPEALLAADVEGLPSRDQGSRNADEIETFRTPQRKGIAKTWYAVCNSGLGRRVQRVGAWVAGGARLLWSIPKAVIQGDSRPLIEAIGNLLSGARAQDDKGALRDVPGLDPDPSGEPSAEPVRTSETTDFD